jgi:hypothetical protein
MLTSRLLPESYAELERRLQPVARELGVQGRLAYRSFGYDAIRIASLQEDVLSGGPAMQQQPAGAEGA